MKRVETLPQPKAIMRPLLLVFAIACAMASCNDVGAARANAQAPKSLTASFVADSTAATVKRLSPTANALLHAHPSVNE